jgi:hypothetical protein
MVPEAGHYPQSQRPGITSGAVLHFLTTVPVHPGWPARNNLPALARTAGIGPLSRRLICRLAGGGEPAEAFRHGLGAADDGAYVA